MVNFVRHYEVLCSILKYYEVRTIKSYVENSCERIIIPFIYYYHDPSKGHLVVFVILHG